MFSKKDAGDLIKIMWVLIVLSACGLFQVGNSMLVKNEQANILFKAGGYKGVTVKIADFVTANNCKTILSNLEATLSTSSHYLFTALDGRAYFQSINIVLPSSWPDTCVPSGTHVTPATNSLSDITVQRRVTPNGIAWTQQTAGCGMPGDQIYLSYDSLENYSNTLGRTLIKEWAKYRYGVFDENGYYNDPVYPMCYLNDADQSTQVTGCSDFPIKNDGQCSGPKDINMTQSIDERARTSIMFTPEASSVTMFCDDGNHNKLAPTKHNFMCNGRSTLDVILKHNDFHQNVENQTKIIDTRPTFKYIRHQLTRYVLVIEDTSDMSLRQSWIFLRLAVRKLALDLPENTEIGLVLANDTSASIVVKMNKLSDNSVRDLISSQFPYTSSDSRTGCLNCALDVAVNMLNARTKTNGPASSVILVIAPGMDYGVDAGLISKTKAAEIRIATINYPGVFRQQPLDDLATQTGGVSFSVFEEKHNNINSHFSTYFQLSNVLYNVAQIYFEGSETSLPMEIYRREIIDDGRNTVSGSFFLSSELGEPATFSICNHNSEQPLIRRIKLVSPSQVVYSERSDILWMMKFITVRSNMNETGTWTYTIERFSGNPQPMYVQVFATPKPDSSQVVRANFWTRQLSNSSVFTLYTSVKRGYNPVLAAKVEVIVSRTESNGTTTRKERFELLDTGNGDPDLVKGDGIYTKYYNVETPGTYTFETVVSDNGNAYAKTDAISKPYDQPCCGSSIPTSAVSPLQSFTRVLPPVTVYVNEPSQIPSGIGRIGDLRVNVLYDELKARLTWTSPDIGGSTVARYEIKYANTVEDITDKYETAAILWSSGTPFPLMAGSETSFTLDLSTEPQFLDQPLYFAIRSYSMLTMGSPSTPISNWVRIYIPSPVIPSTVPPTYDTPLSSWPYETDEEIETVIPRIAQRLDVGIEILLPIIGGVLLLAILLIVYCYFCVLKRKTITNEKQSPKHSNTLNGITIVPQSTPSHHHMESPTHYNDDHNTIGLPYDDEPKKRYSIVQQQEAQLIEELKQQQLSVISNNTLQRNGGRTLSPYESWTASQLLYEHERRHSPMDDDEMMMIHQDQVDHGSNVVQQVIMGTDMYGNQILAPPVPPLPTYNGYPVNYPIYGVHQNYGQQPQDHGGIPNQSYVQQDHPNYGQQESTPNTLLKNNNFNPSVQGSLNSVNNVEKKRRNVTMV